MAMIMYTWHRLSVYRDWEWPGRISRKVRNCPCRPDGPDRPAAPEPRFWKRLPARTRFFRRQSPRPDLQIVHGKHISRQLYIIIPPRKQKKKGGPRNFYDSTQYQRNMMDETLCRISISTSFSRTSRGCQAIFTSIAAKYPWNLLTPLASSSSSSHTYPQGNLINISTTPFKLRRLIIHYTRLCVIIIISFHLFSLTFF